MASPDDFNTTFIELSQQIAIVCPKSFIAVNISLLERMIKQYPTKIIDVFVSKVLKYRIQFETEYEDFFMNANFNNDVGDDNNILKRIFEFKNIWSILSSDNKEIVRQYVIQLFDTASEYLEVVSAESLKSR